MSCGRPTHTARCAASGYTRGTGAAIQVLGQFTTGASVIGKTFQQGNSLTWERFLMSQRADWTPPRKFRYDGDAPAQGNPDLTCREYA